MSDAHGRMRGLDVWLAPFLAVLGRKTRRVWTPLYLRGLLGPGERKSLQPMAARLELAGHDQLQHFIASTAWDDCPAWTVLAHEADRLVGGAGAFLVIDDTALPSRVFCRSAWHGSTAANWASGPTASPWSRSPWRRTRCLSWWVCGCSCPTSGQAMLRVLPVRVYRTRR